MKLQQIAIFAAWLAVLFMSPSNSHAAKSYSFSCARGHVLVGVYGVQGSWMNGVAGLCSPLRNNGTIKAPYHKYLKSTKSAGNTAVASPLDKRRHIYCPAGTVMVGYTGTTGSYVNTIRTLTCQAWDPKKKIAHGRQRSVKAFPEKGKGFYSQTLCNYGMIGLGIKGKRGLYLDRFAVRCAYYPGAKRPQPAKTPKSAPKQMLICKKQPGRPLPQACR